MFVYCADETWHHTGLYKIILMKTVWFGREVKGKQQLIVFKLLCNVVMQHGTTLVIIKYTPSRKFLLV